MLSGVERARCCSRGVKGIRYVRSDRTGTAGGKGGNFAVYSFGVPPSLRMRAALCIAPDAGAGLPVEARRKLAVRLPCLALGPAPRANSSASRF